jgi:hypothetical protein
MVDLFLTLARGNNDLVGFATILFLSSLGACGKPTGWFWLRKLFV